MDGVVGWRDRLWKVGSIWIRGQWEGVSGMVIFPPKVCESEERLAEEALWKHLIVSAINDR